MKRILIQIYRVAIALCTMFTFQATQAQTNPATYAKVVLENGATIKGYVGKSVNDNSIKIVMPGDSTYELHIAFDLIKTLEFRRSRTAERKPVQVKPAPVENPAGFYHSVSFGLMMGEDEVNLSLSNENSYRINDHLSLGLAANYDRYYRVSTAPVYATAKLFLKNQRISPYYFMGGGYGFGWLNKKTANWQIHDEKFRGGVFGQTGVGYQVNGHNGSLAFQLGFRLQKSLREYYYDQGIWSHPVTIDDLMHVSEKRMFRRVFFSMAAVF